MKPLHRGCPVAARPRAFWELPQPSPSRASNQSSSTEAAAPPALRLYLRRQPPRASSLEKFSFSKHFIMISRLFSKPLMPFLSWMVRRAAQAPHPAGLPASRTGVSFPLGQTRAGEATPRCSRHRCPELADISALRHIQHRATTCRVRGTSGGCCG